MYGLYTEIVGFVAGTLEDVEDDKELSLGKSEVYVGDLNFDLAHLAEGYSLPNLKQDTLKRDTLSTIVTSKNLDAIIIVLGQPPFCIEYVTQSITNLIGWSSEEITGLDLVFLQGDGAMGIDVTIFYDVAYTEKEKGATVSGYAKNGQMFSCKIMCSPIYDFSKVLTNIAIKFTDFKTNFDFSDEFIKSRYSNEIGMPLNRTENGVCYKNSDLGKFRSKKSPSEDFALASSLISFGSLSNQLQFISTSRTSTAVALADR